MTRISKLIIGINIIILLIYTVASYDRHNDYYVFLIAFRMGIHLAINLVLLAGMSSISNREYAKAIALSMVLILLIGFPSCFLVEKLGK